MRQIFSLLILAALLLSCTPFAPAQIISKTETYDKIEMLSPDGEKIRELDVRIRFNEDSMEIESKDARVILKKFVYSEIRQAEYSYTKNPRWKTGLGLGAAALAFPLLLVVAIPIGFTKHKRHWLTVRTGNDFAVLKLSKGNRKMFIPAFETHSSVKVIALGDDK